MTQNVNMTNREVCDLIFVDYATKKPFMNLDFANVSTTELTDGNGRRASHLCKICNKS